MRIDRAVEERLRSERIVWLTTVRADGQPQAVPVWFLWDGQEFLIFSEPGKPKLRNIETNRQVSLHLRGSETGGDVVTIEGEARLDPDGPPADRVEGYIQRYRGLIDSYGWTASSFAQDYSVPLRIRPREVRTW